MTTQTVRSRALLALARAVRLVRASEHTGHRHTLMCTVERRFLHASCETSWRLSCRSDSKKDEHMSMKIFLTGATGVIGRRLVPILSGAGHRITAVARSSAARTQLQLHGVVPIEVDLFDSTALRQA